MTKELSTYGVLLLSVMVVFRAVTINHTIENEEIASHIASFSPVYVTKSIQPMDQQIAPSYLAMASPKLATNSHNHALQLPHSDLQSIEVIETLTIAETNNYDAEMDAIILETLDLTESEGLALERESTINSNLSLLFPRQRILQKPILASLGE